MKVIELNAVIMGLINIEVGFDKKIRLIFIIFGQQTRNFEFNCFYVSITVDLYDLFRRYEMSKKKKKNSIDKEKKKNMEGSIDKNKSKKSMFFIFFILIILILSILIKFVFKSNNSLKGKNIILITMDTTRTDHIGIYGKNKADTPNIDMVAKEGTVFRRCITQTPLTLPTHLSMLTGTYPLYNNVRDNVGFKVPEKLEFLSETLKKKGYNTAAFVSTFVLHSKWGMNQGFDEYSDDFNFNKFSIIKVQRRGDITLKKAKSWIKDNKEKKFFSWVHLYDPHTPYDAPEPFGSRYPRDPYRGEIEYMDSILGDFFKFLKEQKLYDKSIIILVGDHGEALGQHGEKDHGFFIYNETVHVPLIIRTPDKKLRKSVNDLVEIVDIAPTVLDMLEIKKPKEYQGESLYGVLRNKKERKNKIAYTESYFPRFHFGWSELKGFYLTDRGNLYKYIIAPKEELYNLKNDPNEEINIIENEAGILKKYKGKFRTFIKNRSKNAIKPNSGEKLSASDMAKFKSLGYIGESLDTSTKKNLKNPKDMVNIIHRLSKAVSLLEKNKEYDKAIDLLSGILEEEKGIMDVMLYLGNAYKKKGMYEKALNYYKGILTKKHDSFSAMFNIINTLLDMNKLEEALQSANMFIKKFPNDFTLYNKLGRILFRMKKYKKTLEVYKKAIDLEPTNSIAIAEIGRVYLTLKDYDKAELYFKRAEKLNPKQFDLNFLFGLLEDERGNRQRAIELYTKEITLNPRSSKALYNLALEEERNGDLEKAEKYFRRVIEIKPRFNFPYFMVAKCIFENPDKLEEAKKMCEDGLAIGIKDKYTVYGYLLLSEIYHRLGNDALAQRNYDIGMDLKEKLGR